MKTKTLTFEIQDSGDSSADLVNLIAQALTRDFADVRGDDLISVVRWLEAWSGGLEAFIAARDLALKKEV